MSALGTRLLKIEVGGSDYTAEVSKAVIVSGESDSDFITFEDAASGGGREYRLEFTAVQDAETGSLWRQVWDNAGSTVAATLIPYGNVAPSATQPHYEMNATITEPDGDFLGGEADASTSARFVFECSWVLDEKPTPVTA
jgi:hypothetical protein